MPITHPIQAYSSPSNLPIFQIHVKQDVPPFIHGDFVGFGYFYVVKVSTIGQH